MAWTRYLPFAGRLLIGIPFLISGIGKVSAYAGTVAYISSVGLPLAPLGWVIAIIVEIGAGLLLVVGVQTRVVALVLALFTLSAAAFFHNNLSDRNQMIHFFKNMMIVGGLIQIVHFGPGRVSWDYRSNKEEGV
jgi:putative oxidoreductase